MKKYFFNFVVFINLLTLAKQSEASQVSELTQKIQKITTASTCSRYSWKNRGRAPAGYLTGVATEFARSLCRLKASTTQTDLVQMMSQADRQNARKDAITHYKSVLSNLRLSTSTAGEETLRTVYTLGLGLGMRESSGQYCTGWDTSAGANRPSNEAEAGLFQASYNSISASTELKKLYLEYQKHPERCDLDIFKQGVKCSPQNILGTGEGANFQQFNKVCPAFATEYAMTLLRILRGHFGPINRLEAEVRPECNSMLAEVQTMVNRDSFSVCDELL